MDLAQFWNNSGGYQINQSLRFNEAYLSRTPSSAGNRQTFTFSVWLKRSLISTAIGGFFGAWSSNSDRDAFRFDTNDELRIFFAENVNANIYSNAKYRDASAWYHLVAAIDTTQATAANRVKIWINGEALSFRSASYPSQNTNLYINNTVAHYIGTTYDQTDQELQGYLAEFHHVDGSALTPSSFGETDTTTGAWIPKRYTGTYGTNGFYLKFDPSATNGIGHDHSGNGNNFTATGFTTSGTGTDVMSDTPTTNWCTFNPLANAWSNSGTGSVADGNLYLSYSSGNWFGKKGTMAVSSGKWYYEWTNTSGGTSSQCGFTTIESASETGSGVYRYRSNGEKVNTSYTASYGATWSTAGDIIGIALDIDAGTIVFYKNGVSQGTAFSSIPAGTYIPECVIEGAGYTGYANFGQRAFAYTPPTGYKALNTANLPEPTIKDGGKYFDATTYTGASANQSIANAGGFQPDLVWIKNRNLTNRWHNLQDSVRGSGYSLFSNDPYEEVNDVGTRQITFQSNGFGLVGTNADINSSTGTYVAWQWKAGGAGSSNNAGTITSTVSANASAGFSIVTYTGNATSGATVGHGLGVAPNFVIIKDRSAAFDWRVWLTTFGTGNALSLNSTAGTSSNSAVMQAAPSSSVMSLLGSGYSVNNSGNTYVAYCFSEVAGYSKFGSYTGNGSTDGPAVWCGFRPAWLLIKRTDSSSDWILQDSKRLGYNVDNNDLIPNQSYAEATDDRLDQLSNGFKLRSTFATSNASGGTYIFAAFAELPFKYANAR